MLKALKLQLLMIVVCPVDAGTLARAVDVLTLSCISAPTLPLVNILSWLLERLCFVLLTAKARRAIGS